MSEGRIIQLELKYCEACGALWLRPAGSGVTHCRSCCAVLSELAPRRERGQSDGSVQ